MTKKKTEEDKTATAKSTRKRLSPKQWAEAEALWESGEFTLEDLSRKFGIAPNSIYVHMKKVGAEKGAKAAKHKAKVAEEVTKAATEEATILAARIRETKEDHYKMASGIAKLTWAEVLTAKQNNVPIATIANNVKALDGAMTVLAKARIERFAVLGLDKDHDDDDDGLPELLISELTADQIEELRNRDFSEFVELPEELGPAPSEAGEAAAADDDGVVEET